MLMIEKESSAKAFLKSSSAKPNSSKTDSLRAIRDEKECEFDKCSQTAAGEIKRFHQKRLLEMKDTLVTYTEGQIMCAKSACDELSKCVMKMKDFPLPQMATLAASSDYASYPPPDGATAASGGGRTSQLNSVSSYTSQ